MRSELGRVGNGVMEARWLDADGVEQKERGSPCELAAIIKYAGVHHDVVLLFDVDRDGEPTKLCFACWRPATQSTVRIRQRLEDHINHLRRIARSCVILLALLMVVGCRGPVGPQGDVGAQGDVGQQGEVGQQGDVGQQGEPGPMNGDVIRVSGRLDTDGFAGFTILENEDTSWPERMPLVNVWLRETSSDAYALISIYGGMVVVVPNPDSMREIIIGFGVKGFAGWQYLLVIVFYDETQIALPGLRFPVVDPPVRATWRRPLINDRPDRAQRARHRAVAKPLGNCSRSKRIPTSLRSGDLRTTWSSAKAHQIDILFLV